MNNSSKAIALIITLFLSILTCGCTDKPTKKDLFDTAYDALRNDDIDTFSSAVKSMYMGGTILIYH